MLKGIKRNEIQRGQAFGDGMGIGKPGAWEDHGNMENGWEWIICCECLGSVLSNVNHFHSKPRTFIAFHCYCSGKSAFQRDISPSRSWCIWCLLILKVAVTGSAPIPDPQAVNFPRSKHESMGGALCVGHGEDAGSPVAKANLFRYTMILVHINKNRIESMSPRV